LRVTSKALRYSVREPVFSPHVHRGRELLGGLRRELHPLLARELKDRDSRREPSR
jgi:hypothetical protein